MPLRFLLLCCIAIYIVRADSNGCVCQGDNCNFESTLTDGKSTANQYTQNNSKIAERVQINFPGTSGVGVACYLFKTSTTSTTFDLWCYKLDISYSSTSTTTTEGGVNSTFPGNLSATMGAGNKISGISPSPTTFTTTTVNGRTMICTRTYHLPPPLFASSDSLCASPPYPYASESSCLLSVCLA